MQDLSQKSVPLLISKFMTAVSASTRGRSTREATDRLERIKDELVVRGEASVEPLIEILRTHDGLVGRHAAAVIGQIGAASSVVPLAKILAGSYPVPAKNSAALALASIKTPESALALNIWHERISAVRDRLTAYAQQGEIPPDFEQKLQSLAHKHRVLPQRIAESWLLAHAPGSLSPEAEARLREFSLSPDDNAYLEA